MRNEEVHGHQAVFMDELLHGLAVDPAGFYIDATYGRGGHSAAILQILNEQGRLFVFDKDPEACEHAQHHFGDDPRFHIHQGSFTDMSLLSDNLAGSFAGIFFDLGVSSPQLSDSRRGFSFQSDGPLDMRMDSNVGISATEWLDQADRKEIERVIRTYGEERHAAKIAAVIKNNLPLRTTRQLAKLVERVSTFSSGIHPATRTFLAIRLYLNRELEDLSVGLESALHLLRVGGRLAVISFHSLEDRIVKDFIRRFSTPKRLPKLLPVPDDYSNVVLKKIDKLIRPTPEEIARNPRSRSARLRLAEKIKPIESGMGAR